MRHGSQAYVQAKLNAIVPEESKEWNGNGVVQSSIVLYQVSKSAKKKMPKSNINQKRKNKDKRVQEPKDFRYVWFYLN